MVREFQKHTDSLPIPRSDIDGKQVDSCAVSFAALARTCARHVDCFLSYEYRRIPSFATASRENAIDPINLTRNSAGVNTSGKEYFFEFRLQKEKKITRRNFVSRASCN